MQKSLKFKLFHCKSLIFSLHYFKENQYGATLFCKQLGYSFGSLTQESQSLTIPLPKDGIIIGKCLETDTWPNGNCSGGNNNMQNGYDAANPLCVETANYGTKIDCFHGNHHLFSHSLQH